MVAGLQTDDSVLLVEQLDDLRKFTEVLRREVNKIVQGLIKAAAERKARAVIEAGITFDAITINGAMFRQQDGDVFIVDVDDDIPF